MMRRTVGLNTLMKSSPSLVSSAALRPRRNASSSAGARSGPKSPGECDQALRAGGKVGHQRHRFAGLNGADQLPAAARRPARPGATFSTKMRMAPPQASPTLQALSSSTPNSRDFGCAGGDDFGRLGDDFGLDAAPRHRAEKIPLGIDQELAADRLRRRAPGLNDGGKRHAAALAEPIERLRQDERVWGSHGKWRRCLV